MKCVNSQLFFQKSELFCFGEFNTKSTRDFVNMCNMYEMRNF